MYVRHQFQNLEISVEDFSSNFEFLLSILNASAFDTQEYPLGGRYDVNDAEALKNLYHHYSFI